MVTKCYLLRDDDKTLGAIADIVNRIPCFVDAKDCGKNTMEFTIKCRAEDLPFVERKLARFV